MKRPAPLSSADVRGWGRLAALALAAAEGPGAIGVQGDLARAAKAARGLPVLGPLERSSPFVRLTRVAARFCEETARGRLELAPELAELARAVRAALDDGAAVAASACGLAAAHAVRLPYAEG